MNDLIETMNARLMEEFREATTTETQTVNEHGELQ
jgi:hypothetical protein